MKNVRDLPPSEAPMNRELVQRLSIRTSCNRALEKGSVRVGFVCTISAAVVLRASVLAFLVALSACGRLPVSAIPQAPRAGAPLAIFDIDGTLTPGVRSINSVRPHAAAAVRAYADKGYAVVYLSARIPMFQSSIPGWLHRNGFPEGGIHVPQSDSDQDDPAAFKQRILNLYAANGWRLAAAFGDSSTDFEAYTKAGIPQDRIFAILRDGSHGCEPGQWKRCLQDWSGLLPLLEDATP